MSECRRCLLSFLFCAVISSALAAPVVEEVVREEYAVTQEVRLTVQNAEGTVHIYGSNEPGVKLTAIKKAYSKERLAGIKVNVTNRGDTLAVETVFPSKPEGITTADRSGTVDYVLFVPQTCTLAGLQVENGEIIVHGLRGAGGVQISLTSGRMQVLNCFTATQVKLGRGGANIVYDWWEPTDFAVTVAAEHGDVNLGLPPGAQARLDLAAETGTVTNYLAGETRSRSLVLTTEQNPNAVFTVRVQEGDVRLGRPY